MIQIVFSKNNSCLSKVIRWLSNEPVSHVAIIFDQKIAFHSNLYGTHPNWFCSFLKKNEIVYAITLNMTLEQEEEIYLKIPQYDGKWYDFGALFYMLYRGILHKLFNTPIPQTNIFGKEDQFLCVELAQILDPHLEKLDVITPYQLYLILKDKYK